MADTLRLVITNQYRDAIHSSPHAALYLIAADIPPIQWLWNRAVYMCICIHILFHFLRC